MPESKGESMIPKPKGLRMWRSKTPLPSGRRYVWRLLETGRIEIGDNGVNWKRSICNVNDLERAVDLEEVGVESEPKPSRVERFLSSLARICEEAEIGIEWRRGEGMFLVDLSGMDHEGFKYSTQPIREMIESLRRSADGNERLGEKVTEKEKSDEGGEV